MHFLLRPPAFSAGRRRYIYHIRTLYDAVSTINCPRDRGLDHAVARERHLKPLLNLKNLIISEPSKSVPLSVITQSKEILQIPFRPIEFIRRYPSIFQEFHPGSLKIQPHIKLTPEVVSLSAEENLLYQSVNYKQDIAGRLLKLLMISRVNKIPIFVLDRLKWELGLPSDYEKVIVPDFPDYFRVIDGKKLGESWKALELVCWNDEFASSEMEKKGAKDGKVQFCLQHSNGFEMDKKYKKWVEEWQKLPYVSPYENAMHLAAKTDESDKWVVGVLHELLSLFVGKKVERDNLLCLGEYFGLRSRFKLALLQHAGIFYVSSKIGTHTVVLKEAYKRGMLIERHPLMDMRFKYVQLMNVVEDGEKSKGTSGKSGINVKKNEREESKDGESGEEDDDDDEIQESSDDDQNDDYVEDDEVENATQRGKYKLKAAHLGEKHPKRSGMKPGGRITKENAYRSSMRISMRSNTRDDRNVRRRVAQNDDFMDENEVENSNRTGRFKRRAPDFGAKRFKRSDAKLDRQNYQEKVYRSSTRHSRRRIGDPSGPPDFRRSAGNKRVLRTERTSF